jgi:hypothetical protein
MSFSLLSSVEDATKIKRKADEMAASKPPTAPEVCKSPPTGKTEVLQKKPQEEEEEEEEEENDDEDDEEDFDEEDEVDDEDDDDGDDDDDDEEDGDDEEDSNIKRKVRDICILFCVYQYLIQSIKSKKRRVNEDGDSESEPEVHLNADDLVGLDTTNIIPRATRRAASAAMSITRQEQRAPQAASKSNAHDDDDEEEDEESDEAEF